MPLVPWWKFPTRPMGLLEALVWRIRISRLHWWRQLRSRLLVHYIAFTKKTTGRWESSGHVYWLIRRPPLWGPPGCGAVMKIGPKAAQNQNKMEPGIMRNPISAKVDFCNTSLSKCLVFQSQTPRFRPKNQQETQPGNKYEKFILFGPKVSKKLSKWVPQINKNR